MGTLVLGLLHRIKDPYVAEFFAAIDGRLDQVGLDRGADDRPLPLEEAFSLR